VHTVVRTYSGKGAAETIDLVIASKKEIKKLMRSVKGFVEYSAIRTEDGGFTITVSKNSKASDAITAIAKDWVLAHAAHLKARPPTVVGGTVELNFEAD
jgi:hypothetical protein